MASARARALVALCKQTAGSSRRNSSLSASSDRSVIAAEAFSPCLSKSWDDVYEASDLNKLTLARPAVKRKLSFSPPRVSKAVCSTANTTHKAPLPLGALNVNKIITLKTPHCTEPIDASCNSTRTNLKGSKETDEDRCPAEGFVESDTLESNTESGFQYPMPPTNVKKKPLYPSQQKIYEARLALNAGKEHFNSIGKFKQARVPKTPCKLECKRCSCPRLTNEERFAISRMFWDLSNHEKQWLYIHKSIALSAPKRKCVTKGSNKEKHFNREYYFYISNEKRKVCKSMFKSTLSICDSWIVNALSHCSDGQVTIQDSRGKCKSS